MSRETKANPFHVPADLQTQAESIWSITGPFCLQHLDEEYRDLCRKMIAALARKRPSPLARGQARIWAGGVLYTLGQINFLFDPSVQPHIRADKISDLLGCSASTVSQKAAFIRKALNLDRFEMEYSRKDMQAENPMYWLILVNGLAVDARQMPVEIQREAFQKRLIPFVYAERVLPVSRGGRNEIAGLDMAWRLSITSSK